MVAALLSGEAAAWDGFVVRYSPIIYGAIIKTLRKAGRGQDEAADVAQTVFLRLCRDEFRLLRQYDSRKAGLSTWLTIVSTSSAVDHLRRDRRERVGFDELPEHASAVAPVEGERLVIPPNLLSPRQLLVLQMLYDRDMDVAEVAETLAIDAQTVRSTRHKAMAKLRAHFGKDLED